MNQATVDDKVRALVADELSVDERDITPESRFVEDLGADSLDLVELMMRFEEEFEIEVYDAEAEKCATVGDATKLVIGKLRDIGEFEER
jgi:acyl carrier protein